MNNELLFDFIVNRENNTIRITREFDAGIELVWKAWTTAELLDQWWGPEPWRAETKTLDFREGAFGSMQWSALREIKVGPEPILSLL